MRTFALILAAGQGTRFGDDKTRATLGGQALWRWSYEAFANHPKIGGIGLMGNEKNLEELKSAGARFTALGGATRQETSAAGCRLVPDDFDIVLIHDAARPFVSQELISRVIEAVERVGAAGPAIPVRDTLRLPTDSGYRLVDRHRLLAMQTPQGARRELFLRAHDLGSAEVTDDLELMSQVGQAFELVEGDLKNLKITSPDDLDLASGILGAGETRTGFGYDVHAFSKDPMRPLMLGGIRFFDAPGLEGHSDADVLIHAVADALLGAAALGDIGEHFPNTDPTWKGEPSVTFLRRAGQLLAESGWRIVNVDATIIAERPKIMPKAVEMRACLAQALGIGVGRVSVKATTNEGLGAIGHGEGIAAHAVATVARI